MRQLRRRTPSIATAPATKGTLEPGKLADLVILDKDPLKVAPTAIKDIRIVETVKEGKSIYTATNR